MNSIGVDFAGLDQMLHFRNCHPSCRGHHGIEVPRSFAIDEVAEGVPFPRFDESKVRRHRVLEHVHAAVEFTGFFPFGDQRPISGRSVKSRYPCSSCSNPFRKRSLRIEFQFDLAGKCELFQEVILTDVCGNNLSDLLCLQQKSDSEAVNAGIVADDRQVPWRPFSATPL